MNLRLQLAALFLALGGAATAHADSLSPLDRTFGIDLGVFFMDTDTTVRLDGSSGQGTEVNFEDDLGLESSDRFRIDGYWRFADRHKVRFMYFDASSDSSRTITEEIIYGDTVYPVNATVTGELETTITEIAYEYAFMRRDNFELAGTIGLHNLSIKAKLHAEASSSGGSGGIDLDRTADGDGPLPVIGLRGIWAISKHFYFDGQVQFFAVEIDEYDGRLEDYKFNFVWQPFQHFGVGLGYNSFVTRLEVDRKAFDGTLRWKYGGPLVFVTGAF